MKEWLEVHAQMIGLAVNVIVEATPDKLQPSWVQTYGQLIGVVIGATMAGVVALVLAIMNNRGSDARLKMQQDHELARENQRVSRDRMEELYVLVGHWTTLLQQNAILGLRLAKGNLTLSQYRDQQIEAARGSDVQAPRMNLLLGVYGSPQVMAAYKEVEDARNAFSTAIYPVELLAQDQLSRDSILINRPKVDKTSYLQLDGLATEITVKARALLETIASETNK